MREVEYGRCKMCRKIWSTKTLMTDKRGGICSCAYYEFEAVWPNRIARAWLRLIGR